MKLLFFTDSHIRGINPRSRTDDFLKALLDKFSEIGEIVAEQGVDFVLNGGDWFDRPDISPSIVREFALIIKDYGKPIYTIAGNHDIFGHNPNTLSRTMLGLLEGTGTINALKDGMPIILEKDNKRVQLLGHSYSYNIDSEGMNEAYIVKKDKSCDCCINIVHGMLLEKPFFEGIKYTLIEDITLTEADITLAGHYHTGFGIKKYKDKYFINPGSIARISAIRSEMERIPQVVIIEIAEEINIRMIALKSAKHGFEILNREHIEEAQLRALKLGEYFNNINISSDYQNIKMDLDSIINEIVNAEGIDEKVKFEAIDRIEKARQKLSEGESED